MKKHVFYQANNNILPNVILAGRVHIPAPTCHFPRTTGEYIMYIVTDGAMKLYEDSTLHTLKAGDVIIFPPGISQHGVRHDSEVEYIYIHFAWDGMHQCKLADEELHNKLVVLQSDSSANESTLFLPKFIHLQRENTGKIIHLAEELRHNAQTPSPYKKSLAACTLLQLFIQCATIYTKQKHEGSSDGNLRVLDILNYIHENYSKDITSDMIADYFYGSYDHLNRLFKKNTGKTIFYYLNEYRIEESKILLHSGALSLRQIAEQVGFKNEFYFSRVFKKYAETNPRDYRRTDKHL